MLEKAFPFNLDSEFVQVLYVDEFLDEINCMEFSGFNEPTDMVAYAIKSGQALILDIRKLKPYYCGICWKASDVR